MKRNMLFLSLCAVLILFFSHICSAELYISRKGLFKIDVPKNWEWVDSLDTVVISSMAQEGAIIIKILPQSGDLTQERVDYLLERGMENMAQKVKEENGIIVSQKSRTLDGLKAKQVDFLLNEDGEKQHAAFMAVFARGYLLTIYMEGPDEAQRAKMEKIAEKIKFLGL